MCDQSFDSDSKEIEKTAIQVRRSGGEVQRSSCMRR